MASFGRQQHAALAVAVVAVSLLGAAAAYKCYTGEAAGAGPQQQSGALQAFV